MELRERRFKITPEGPASLRTLEVAYTIEQMMEYSYDERTELLAVQRLATHGKVSFDINRKTGKIEIQGV